MRISAYKQFLLSTVLGPFGLFNVSAKAAVVLIILTAGALYYSPEHWLYILAVSIVLSMFIGNILVSRHNRLLDKNFQTTTFLGDVSCKVVRTEAADKDYDAALKRVRNKKLVNRLGIASVATLCVAAAAFVVAPKARLAMQSSSNTVAANIAGENNSDESENNTIQAQNSPTDVISSEPVGDPEILLSAIDYQENSYGLYRPKIDMTCEHEIFAATFITDEVLGTDSASLAIKVDGRTLARQKWNVTDTYRVAIAPDAKGLANLLSTANSLSIAYLPFGADHEKVAEFDMIENADAMAQFKNRCQPEILISQPETSAPETEIATVSPEPALQPTLPLAEIQTDSPEPELQVNSTEQELQVLTPEPELQVASPVPELQVDSPEPELQAASPAVELQEISPEPELQAASSESELQTDSPEPELQAASTEPALQAASPEPELQTSSPELQLQAASPEPKIQAASPEPALQTTSPKPVVQQALPGHF